MLAVWLGLASTAPLAADFAVNAGAIEVVALPWAHAGLYPYVGGSVAFPLAHVTLIAALSVEWSFDQGRGGLVAAGTADFPLGPHLGVDLNLTFIHDMPGARVADSVFYLGLGPGVSIFLGRWAISPYVGVFTGLSAPGFSLVPGVNVAFTIG